jgi:DNA-binding NarL/FixJ family response regulator
MGGSALMFVTRLARDYPRLKIVVFSSSKDMAPELLAAGAHGYVVKDDMSRLLITAIQTVMANGQFLSPAAQTYVELASSQGRDVALTARELSIIKLMSQGRGTRAVGLELSLEGRTVQNYIGRMLEKTGCEDRVQLVNWYRRVYGDG